MKSKFLGYRDVSFSFSTDIEIGIPDSGFHLSFGRTGSTFEPVFSFSGHSGYLFDHEGSFFGGYQKNRPFNISGSCFYSETGSRLAYYFKGTLCSNNLSTETGYFDTIEFQDYNSGNSASFFIEKNTGESNALSDSNTIYLLDSGGTYLTY